jgi:hypothetical protein
VVHGLLPLISPARHSTWGAQRQQPVYTGIVVSNFNFNFNTHDNHFTSSAVSCSMHSSSSTMHYGRIDGHVLIGTCSGDSERAMLYYRIT